MEKKIAILTLPLHINFGGNLQAYALYETLNKMGGDVELLNLQSAPVSNFNFTLNTIKQIIKKFIFNKPANHILLDSEKKIIYQNHSRFINENIKLSQPIYDISELNRVIDENDYDAVIVGSDQVWRKEYTPDIEAYFLKFVQLNSVKKISYAASFGVSSWQFDDYTTLRLKELAKKFDYISVREDSAVKLCQEYLDINVDHVLDPTLLLEKGDYLSFYRDSYHKKNKGKIFSYILDQEPNKKKVISFVSEMKNKEVFDINFNKSKENIFIKNIHSSVIPSIEEWISAFVDADFIVTDSFHGMVFSILFNKQFIVLANESRGLTRFTSLLKILNLENRLITSSSNENDLFPILKEEIEFNLVNNILEKKRVIIKKNLLSLLENDIVY